MTEPETHPLALRRKAAGLTQAELAERVGIHRVTLARLEAGAEPGVAVALRLAVALDTAAEWLWAPFMPEGEHTEAVVMSICPTCVGTGQIPLAQNEAMLEARGD